VVAPDERVRAGDPVAEIPVGAMGARVHASISGTVREVLPNAITIEAD
jgi:Na+-translocating ferredoxin:NAD+ oxidoreductase RnfC subunit